MEEPLLDLDLWLDQNLWRRQDQLKQSFQSLFEEIGNTYSREKLSRFFSGSKGIKISKGNNLEGFPYLVMDLVRDFDLDSGCNLRLVSWFGHGLYLCVFFGKNISLDSAYLLEAGFRLVPGDSPWNLPMVLSTQSPTNVSHSKEDLSPPSFQLWTKSLVMHPEKREAVGSLKKEIDKILFLQPTLRN